MTELRQLPVVGRLVVWVGSLLDLLFHSGEFVAIAATFLLDNFHMVYSLLHTLETLAKRLPWLSPAIFDDLVTAALVAIVVIEVGRIARKLTTSEQ